MRIYVRYYLEQSDFRRIVSAEKMSDPVVYFSVSCIHVCGSLVASMVFLANFLRPEACIADCIRFDLCNQNMIRMRLGNGSNAVDADLSWGHPSTFVS
jgi:hypothetical protein